MKTIEVDAASVIGSLTVKVRVKKTHRAEARIKIALFIMKIASIIGGYGFESVDVERNDLDFGSGAKMPKVKPPKKAGQILRPTAIPNSVEGY